MKTVSENWLSRLVAACFIFMNAIGATHMVAYRVQENFYGSPNELMPLYEMAGPLKLSLTSLPIVGFYASLATLVALLPCLIVGPKNWNPLRWPWGRWLVLYVPSLTVFSLFVRHELIQEFVTRPYVDNNGIDLVLGTIGWLIVMLIMRWAETRP